MDDESHAPPAIAGVLPHERESWLPSTDLPWLSELRKKHVAAVREWQAAVEHVASTQASIEEAARSWRRQVRDAIASGKEPPPGVDDAVARATLEVAREDATFARDRLAEVVVSTFAELRRQDRRQELEPHFASLSSALKEALAVGPGGAVASATALLRSQLERFEGEPRIVNLDDAAHAAYAGDDQEMTANAR